MLSAEENELLCRVGPGTPMGNLLRRFWIPGFLEEEIGGPDSAPIRLRLLGEDLVAFKDSTGKIGVLDAFCPHRCAHLYFGRNEESGLRCVYHGWKFDVDGNCVDMPSEPEGEKLKMAMNTISYPIMVRGGVIWIYMGPKELTPEPPEFEWSRLGPKHRTATKRLQECNWAQAVEGGIDSAHISFLHRNLVELDKREDEIIHVKYGRSGNPIFSVVEADYGMLIGARRAGQDGRNYWRITPFLVPFYTMIPPVLFHSEESSGQRFDGHAWVPIDDYNVWTWTFTCQPNRPMSKEELLSGTKGGRWGPVDDDYRPLRNRDNDYLLDREMQRTENFTGLVGIPNQDAAVQESMGPIVNRTREHLGTSDSAIIAFRRIVLNLARDLETGIEPKEAGNGAWYNVRSGSIILDADVPFNEGAAHLLRGGQIIAAAD